MAHGRYLQAFRTPTRRFSIFTRRKGSQIEWVTPSQVHSADRCSRLSAILLSEVSVFRSVSRIDGKKAVGMLSNGPNEGGISESRRWVHSRLGRGQELLEEWERDVGDGN